MLSLSEVRMRKFQIILLFTVAGFMITSCETLLEMAAGTAARPNSITNEEAIVALRDALSEGSRNASAELSQKDGYFGNPALKILLPPEAKPILDTLSKIPQGQKLVDDVVLRLNRSAEDAAKEVVPIFVNAITSMTIADGLAIVKGGDRAATDYLEVKIRSRLFELYRPKVDTALGKPLVLSISAKKAWETLVNGYNSAGTVANTAARLAGKKPPMPPVEVDLSTYATNRALDGIFIKIAEEEAKIRKNPLSYASSMIKKVFSALKEGLL